MLLVEWHPRGCLVILDHALTFQLSVASSWHKSSQSPLFAQAEPISRAFLELYLYQRPSLQVQTEITTCLAECTLSNDFDRLEILQTNFRTSKTKVLRFSLPMAHELSLLSFVRHQNISLQFPFELHTPGTQNMLTNQIEN